MISYFFPPLASPGSIRTLRFVKHLPELGWLPTVLTPESSPWAYRDTKLLEQVPRDCRVIHTPGWEPKNKFLVRLLGRVLVPDTELFWSYSAREHGLRFINNTNTAVIYTCSYPYSAHLTGAWLSRVTGLPWVADFRDPWTFHPFRQYGRARKRIEKRLEQHVMAEATAVILNIEETRKLYEELYPSHKGKFHAIPNGFDIDDFPQSAPARKEEVVISYIGSAFYARQPLRVFFDALAQVLEDPSIKRASNIKVVLAGRSFSGLDELPPSVAAITESRGLISHADATSLMREADLLLMTSHGEKEGQDTCIPAKTYEYAASGSRILAISEKCATQRFVQDLPGGHVARPTDRAEMIQVIKQALDADQAFFPRIRLEKLQPFDSRHLTKRLADLFNSII